MKLDKRRVSIAVVDPVYYLTELLLFMVKRHVELTRSFTSSLKMLNQQVERLVGHVNIPGFPGFTITYGHLL